MAMSNAVRQFQKCLLFVVAVYIAQLIISCGAGFTVLPDFCTDKSRTRTVLKMYKRMVILCPGLNEEEGHSFSM
jgi:hypothetical protein